MLFFIIIGLAALAGVIGAAMGATIDQNDNE